jgi:hypothetical protein
MHIKWTKPLAAGLLAVTLAAAPGAGMVFAAEAGTVQSVIQADFRKLTDKVSAQWVGAYLERAAHGTTVGAVVRLRNETGSVTRVPDYELRLLASDGVVYTLSPSAANPRSIQPKGEAELVYSLDVNRSDAFELVKALWVEVDEYVYPKKETTLLTMDIAGKVWTTDGKTAGKPAGSPAGQSGKTSGEKADKAAAEEGGKLSWGQPFRMDLLAPELEFTPAGIHQQVTARGGNATIVTLRVVNKGKDIAYIPEFAVSGSDGAKLYAGQKADDKSDALNPGESRNVRFAIETAASVDLTELVVTTPARFVTAQGIEIVRQIGHLSISLPESGFSLGSLGSYELGKPIALDPSNELVDKDVQISLVELHLHEYHEDGYKTAVAKFKLHNTGKKPAALPDFQAELVNDQGYTYLGERQMAVPSRLMPGLSHVVSYAFNVPKSEEEGRYALRLLEGGTLDAPYSTPFAQVVVAVQNESEEESIWNLYPFQVRLKSWSVSATLDDLPIFSYSYKMTLDLDIERTEDVVVDSGFSKLKIELADSFGVVLGSETFSFVGPNRLIDGKQTLRFNNLRTEQHQYPLTINIYEAIDTPSGEATRLLQTLRQK